VNGQILVVEDDNELRDVLARGLRAEGYEVLTAVDGTSALRTASPDLAALVLDIGLPDADGRDVCQALRSRGIQAPVLFLTARRGVDDRLSGFAAGGDDYLPKPFAFPELVARVNAMVRRAAGPPSAVATDDSLRVDPVGHSLHYGDNRVVLTPIEFRLLARLLAAPSAIVRRRQLMDSAWAGTGVTDNVLDQYMTKLRRRLVEVGAPHEIRVTRGVGYELS
jgi:two-component system response regulator MprA